jgi:exopolysaccharide biosynthesis WecB/TagA/CpsF family protein
MKIFNIVLFMHDFSSGGVERMRLRLAGELVLRGHIVTLVVNNENGPLREECPKNISIINLSVSRSIYGIIPLSRIIRSIQPDVIVSSLDHNNIILAMSSYISFFSTKIILCQHNSLAAELRLGFYYAFIPLLYRLVSPRVSAFIAVSEGVADDLSRITGIRRSKICRIYNPVVDDSYLQIFSPPHPWLMDKKSAFIFVGRLVEQKDPELAIRAIAGCNNRSVRLIFVGDGPLFPRLCQLARDLNVSGRILFCGYMKDTRPWIKYARALIVTSKYEGFCNVIAESLALGTPVITVDCPYGPSEIICSDQFGILINLGDQQRVSSELNSFTDSIWDRKILQSRGMLFSLHACANSHEALFERVTSPRYPFMLKLQNDKNCSNIKKMTFFPKKYRGLVVTPNIDHLRLLRRGDFYSAYKAAEMIFPDGFPLVAFARIRGHKSISRFTGCDLLHNILHAPEHASSRIFFILESQETAQALADGIADGHFKPVIGYAVAPPDLRADYDACMHLCADARAFYPLLVVVTLGAPVSEIFAASCKELLPVAWVLCVGQALRVELGITRRAPVAVQYFLGEWLWCLLHEPRRLFARYFAAGVYFIWAIMQDIIYNRDDIVIPYGADGIEIFITKL